MRAFDPVAGRAAARALADVASHHIRRDIYEAAAGADALVIMTEWNEFRGLDLERARALDAAGPSSSMRGNALHPAQTRALGFTYLSTGSRGRAAAGVTERAVA